jgi:hypothetical protein
MIALFLTTGLSRSWVARLDFWVTRLTAQKYSLNQLDKEGIKDDEPWVSPPKVGAVGLGWTSVDHDSSHDKESTRDNQLGEIKTKN